MGHVRPAHVELVGGPWDGHRVTEVRYDNQPMPQLLRSHEGYRRGDLDTRVTPPRWRYLWTYPRSGIRQRCTVDHSTGSGTGCPRRRTP